MCKKIVYCLAFLIFPYFIQAQSETRQEIYGAITVPESDDASGITVFNEATHRGTISTEDGTFKIKARISDRIVFSSVQFDQFSVLITEKIAKSKILNVDVHVAVNNLPEVTVSPNKLSGNIDVDVNRIKITSPELPDANTKTLPQNPPEVKPESVPIRNQARLSSQTWLVNGLNLKNIFKVATGNFDKKHTDFRNIPYEELDDELKKMYATDFFSESLHLKPNQVNDFIFYAADNGLDGKMLIKKNELEILQFLMQKRKDYEQFLDEEPEALN
ncbi:hypothetical protein [Zunongwangia sp.]|uniref:hypothetical protein n=1 Tax=Zunongwangia sp. TaxID=1965325 RepID=UPI003AA8076C